MTLSYLIGVDGMVKDKKIVKSSGFAALDSSAFEALAKCMYHPALLDGQPVERWMSMQWVWTLE